MSYALCLTLPSFGSLPEATQCQVLCKFVEGIALTNEAYMRRHHVPLLFESGVVYREENLAFYERQWWDAVEIVEKGYADCKGLAAYLIGELRAAGVAAYPKVRKVARGRFHVTVITENEEIDPSERLGM